METIKVALLCALLHQFLAGLLFLTEKWENERRERRRKSMFFLQQLQAQNLYVLTQLQKKRAKRRPAFRLNKGSQDWWERIVRFHFKEQDWLENFRMSRTTFKFVCQRLEPHLRYKKTCVLAPMSVEKQVAIALYKLASCAEYRVVANQFGTHKTMVRRCLHRVCEALYVEFKDHYLKLPNEMEAQEIADGFENMCGIPNVIGAIDGTHIPILPPAHGHSVFMNSKGWPSYNVMAVVDHLHRFRYATCQHAGSVHDASVLENSMLFKFSDALLPKSSKNINGTEIPYLLLGDPAYPLLPWLIKGYEGNISKEEESFNVWLNSGKAVVENAFGRLKSRFRCLTKPVDMYYKFIPQIVISCLILHNIIETRNDKFQQNWLKAVESAELVFPQPHYTNTRDLDSYNAALIRETLKNYMTRYPVSQSRLP